jgi:ATP-dependent RNA helicase RhlB
MFKRLTDLFKKIAGPRKKPFITPITQAPRPVVVREQRIRDRQEGRPQRDRQPRPDRNRAPGTQPAERPARKERQEEPQRHDRRPQSPRVPHQKPGPTPELQRQPPRTPHPKPVSTPEPQRQLPPWNPAEFTIPPEEGKVRFHDLDLPQEVMRAIFELGFRYCTPIQAEMLKKTLSGGDATGRAQTGTGKTAAFLITILTHLLRSPAPPQRRKGAPRALILAPTRELVLQIVRDAKGLSRHMSCSTVAVFGGMEYVKQERLLRSGFTDIIAATPGRLLDFKQKKIIDLSSVEILVIDEADRMLDMGFIPDVRRIIESTPMKGKRQTMFFSATLTPDVNRLASAWTRDAVQFDVTPPRDITLASIDQVVYITTDEEKFTLLYNMITTLNLERVMVFANRRDETQFLKDLLTARGIRCGLLSGDVAQEQRVKTLEAFRSGALKVLVATDVAARGLHIEGVSHVVNYSLPMDPEDYVHRIGRTGRAGASGTSVSFATETEAYQIPEIEQYIGRSLKAVQPDPELLTPLPALAEGVQVPRKRSSRPHRRGNQPRRR